MSTEFQDDLAAGNGRAPLPEQIVAVRDHLKRHNRSHSITDTLKELLAREFVVSRATVGRDLKAAGATEPNANPVRKANIRAEKNRKLTARSHVKPALETKPLSPADVQLPPDIALPQMIQLLRRENSSTQLAISENRARMALNIIIAHWLAAKPELILLDMRGAAALIDALTIAAKLSGGASIDISIPTGAEREAAADDIGPNGHDMKDVTPKQSALVMEIDKWRHAQNGA